MPLFLTWVVCLCSANCDVADDGGVLLPANPAAGDVRAVLLGRQHAFFETLALAVDEVPQRAVADR